MLARLDAIDHGVRAPAAGRILFGELQAPRPQETRLAQHLGHVAAFQPAHDLRLAAGRDPEAHDEEETRVFHRLGTRVRSMTRMMARRRPALKASDKCMPIRLPVRPTVTPLNERRPRADMLKSPMMRPRISGGAFSCTSVCAIA